MHACLAPLLILTALAAVLPASRQVTTVASVNLDRYVGTWFEVARFENRFQKNCVGDVRALYTRRDDGRIDVVNQCRQKDGSTTTARGVAKVADAATSAKLKVRFAPAFLSFIPAVWGDYWVIGLADDYSWAAVGSPDRKYLWILSRTPVLPDDRLAAAIARVRANGFDENLLKATPQAK